MSRDTDRLNDAFRDVLLRMEASRREWLVEAAKADPIRYKTTLQWSDGIEPRWRYFDGGVDRRGTRRRFCWTTTRNAAGYFLTFDEVVRKDGRGERTRIVASKRRETCKEKARARYRAFANRRRKAD